MTNKIQIACLPNTQTTSYPSVNINSWAVGWGTTSFGGSKSTYLQNVKLFVYNGNTYCNRYQNTNWNTQICAGNYSGGVDTCQGDSGGPLYVYDTIGANSKYVIAGITSYGNGCAQAEYPGFFSFILIKYLFEFIFIFNFYNFLKNICQGIGLFRLD